MPDTLCRLCNTKNSVFTSHFTCQSHKIVKHNQKIRRQQPTNCLSVFNHFVGLALKELNTESLFSVMMISCFCEMIDRRKS